MNLLRSTAVVRSDNRDIYQIWGRVTETGKRELQGEVQSVVVDGEWRSGEQAGEACKICDEGERNEELMTVNGRESGRILGFGIWDLGFGIW